MQVCRVVSMASRQGWSSPIRGISSSAGITFQDHVGAFGSKSTWEVVRALAVLRLCTVRGVGEGSLWVLEQCHRLGIEGALRSFLKPTFYAQFVGGETDEELRRCMQLIDKGRMRAMLAATMEEDLGHKRSEEVYNSNCDRILHAIKMASEEVSAQPMIQLKLSGLLPAKLLLKLGNLFENHKNPLVMVEIIAQGLIGKSVSSLDDSLSEIDSSSLRSAVSRFKVICEEADRREVKILVDAEATYLNPGLDVLTMGAVAAFNSRQPRIWNTYQCYLKGALTKVQSELQTIHRSLGCSFGAKVVRGAYLLQERKRAQHKGLPDPVCDNYEDTSSSFDSVVSYLLDKASEDHSRCQFIIASHNEDSILNAVKRMSELNMDKLKCGVSFGQLYGMCDQVSNTLGVSGYAVYKSVPYGTLSEVLPYLARRAAENRSVLQRATHERKLLSKELRRRLRGALPFY